MDLIGNKKGVIEEFVSDYLLWVIFILVVLAGFIFFILKKKLLA